MMLNVGCGTHYAAGWWNTDVWQDDTTRPDEVVDPNCPLATIPTGSCVRVNLSHVLEHIPGPTSTSSSSRLTGCSPPAAPCSHPAPTSTGRSNGGATASNPGS